MVEELKALLGEDQGMFLFTSLPAQGMTSTMTVALGNTDRLLERFCCIGR